MVIADLTSKGIIFATKTAVASSPAAGMAGLIGGSESTVIEKLSSIIERCQKSKQKKKKNSE